MYSKDKEFKRKHRRQGTCFLWSYNKKLGESVTGLFFGPDIFVSLVVTGVLKKIIKLIIMKLIGHIEGVI